MMELNTPKNIFQFTDDDATILTPNRRLTATLHKLHNQHQLAMQHTTWQTPDILPLTSWLERTWIKYISSHIDSHSFLLNQLQQQFLWEKILTNANEDLLLLQPAKTAEVAKKYTDKIIKSQNIFLEEARVDDDSEFLLGETNTQKLFGKSVKELRDKSKRSEKELLMHFFKWCEKAKNKTVVGHCIHYDFAFLQQKAFKYGIL